MRSGPTEEALAGSLRYRPQVAAWMGPLVTAPEVPVISGRVTVDVTQKVPEKLSLTVPRYSTVDGRRFDWRPGTDVTHPLARYGQTLTVQIVCVSSVTGTQWTSRIGRYRIQSWQSQDDGTVTVEAVGMLQVVADDLLTAPVAPQPDGTLASEFRRLLPSGFTVSIDPALLDRACPQSMAWAEDRLGALYDIAEAWPARLRTSEDGWRLKLLPPLPTLIPQAGTTVVTFYSGTRGVTVSAPPADTRDGTYNRIVARSSSTDLPASTLVQAVVDTRTGPTAPNGQYRPVTKMWSTPLATTEDQLAKAGATWLANNARPSRTVGVTTLPDPRVELDDPAVVYHDGPGYVGWVVGYDLPLTYEDTMLVRLGVGV